MSARPPVQQGLAVECVVADFGEPLRKVRGSVLEVHLTIVVVAMVPRPSMLISTVCPSVM